MAQSEATGSHIGYLVCVGFRFPGTLSSRIIAGFVVVIVTVAVISALSVLRLNRLDQEIGVIRGAYLQLALRSLDLAERQTSLLDYLNTDLELEVSAERARARLRQFRTSRNRVLSDMERIAKDARPPESHVPTLEGTSRDLLEIRELARKTDDLYAQLLKRPPVHVALVLSPAASQERKKARESLQSARRTESAINNVTRKLENKQRHLVVHTAAGLQEGSRYLRTLSITFGVWAVGVGLLVAVLVAISLRPLQRLRIGAQNIARGDYGSRIDERGPTDVAELAREFNLMRTAVEERERELVRSERLAAVGKMAATIAHEVRNPLSSIGLNTELLEDELSTLPADRVDEARSLCQAITGEVDRLTGITGSYLSLASVPEPRKKQRSVNTMVASLVEFEQKQLLTRGVQVKLNLSSAVPETLFDENQIRQALLNLIRNAADALESVGGGTVTIATGYSDTDVFVSVADAGPGIPPEEQARIFDAFYTTKSGNRSHASAGGTGLGLAISHQIVREHGGEIKLSSELGAGATFTIHLLRA